VFLVIASALLSSNCHVELPSLLLSIIYDE
jgi:hypothetical protein